MDAREKMDASTNDQQPKPERLRTRWTPSLDKVFAELVVEQIRLGNRPNNVFDKKTWNCIRSEFNRLTNLDFNNNQLRKHLDVLRTRYYAFKSSSSGQNDALVDSCFPGFDLWEDIVGQPKPETSKVKECPIYEELCLIFEEPDADGKYAQSSHYGELDKSAIAVVADHTSFIDSENASPMTPLPLTSFPGSMGGGKSGMEKKRKRLPEDSAENSSRDDGEMIKVISQTLQEMIASSKTVVGPLGDPPPLQTDKRFTISKCIKALDDIEGIHDALYCTALDWFEDPNLREMFLSLNSSVRLSWLQGRLTNFFLD